MQHLILNSFSGFFKFNSIYAAQPFYTPAENKKIFERLKKADLFTFDPPAQMQPTIPITSHAALREVLSDQKNFRVPWDKVPSLATYMMASDGPESDKQRSEVSSLMYGDVPAESFQFFADASKILTKELLDKKSYALGRKGLRQVDIVAEYVQLDCFEQLSLTILPQYRKPCRSTLCR